jgi:hypothetical protein
MTVRVTPGPPSTAASRARAEELQRLRAQELDLVRAQAEKWRNGLAALLLLIATVSVVKGRDSITELLVPVQVLVGVLLLAALVLAGVGTFLGMRAAYGLPRATVVDATLEELLEQAHARAARSVQDMRRALWLTFATLALLVAAIGVTWYGPTAPAATARLVTSDGTVLCGHLTRADATSFVLRVGGVAVTVPRSSTRSLTAADTCTP